ncbi:hypothetical protein B0H21DRAFT_759915 [Amylocystis lapponica]|nr:hypothetical protein B0H21DRAFT_759915 [Amylocystis lapponica]
MPTRLWLLSLSHYCDSVMATVSPLPYTLSSTCSVKWTATQEKSLSTEYPFVDLTTETPEDYVSRTYLQFLWLPESIMPLNQLVPCLLRVTSTTSLASSTGTTHPLHGLLSPLLLTPRTASQKYHTHIAQILEDEGGAGDAEEHMMWFALKFDKSDETQDQDADTDEEAAERWQQNFLDRMERRDADPDSTPTPPSVLPVPAHTPEPPDVLDRLPPHLSPRKRKRKQHEPASKTPPRTFASEDVLETFMDKLSMWQLMTSLDEEESRHSKGKQNADHHDWMQAFCTDVVEPLFKPALPELCALLREKVFQDASSYAGSSASSPPGSPQPQQSKRSTSRASSNQGTQRDRTRSLSLTLEAEPFKGRAARPKPKLVAQAKATRIPPDPRPAGAARADSAQGVTLVAATPVKPKDRRKGKDRAQTQTFVAVEQDSPTRVRRHSQALPQARLPSLAGIIEGDGDDEEWMLESSPDDPAWGDDLQEDVFGRVFVEGTPTKPRDGGDKCMDCIGHWSLVELAVESPICF